MTSALGAEPLPEIERVNAATSPAPTRRRARSRHGLLMQRALDLRDELPTGRRRAEIPRRRSYLQVVVGAITTVSGVAILVSVDPVWNWLGALAAGLGPPILLLGATDILNKGDEGTRRVAQLFRVVRISGLVLTISLVVLELFVALAAVGLLAAAVFQGQWSQTVESLLANAVFVAAVALGLTLMVRVAELPVVPLGRIYWWRELWALRQITHVAIAVTVVGAAVAFSLRDAGGVAIAMVGLATVLLGWARADRTATDEAIRRLAVAADALSSAFRPLVANPSPADEATQHDAISALEALEVACYRHMRSGLVRSAPRYLVDAEVLAVIRACKVALTVQPLEGIISPMTAEVARALRAMRGPELEREILIFAADVRQLATRAPDRLDLARTALHADAVAQGSVN